MLRNVKRPYRKRLILDVGLVYIHSGELAQHAGEVVTVIAHYGPFRAVRTSDGAMHYGVGRGLLEAIGERGHA